MSNAESFDLVPIAGNKVFTGPAIIDTALRANRSNLSISGQLAFLFTIPHKCMFRRKGVFANFSPFLQQLIWVCHPYLAGSPYSNCLESFASPHRPETGVPSGAVKIMLHRGPGDLVFTCRPYAHHLCMGIVRLYGFLSSESIQAPKFLSRVDTNFLVTNIQPDRFGSSAGNDQSIVAREF